MMIVTSLPVAFAFSGTNPSGHKQEYPAPPLAITHRALLWHDAKGFSNCFDTLHGFVTETEKLVIFKTELLNNYVNIWRPFFFRGGRF